MAGARAAKSKRAKTRPAKRPAKPLRATRAKTSAAKPAKAAPAKGARAKAAPAGKPRAKPAPAQAPSARPKLRVSDAAVAASTGKTWREWFTLLERTGAGKRTHREIARLLRETHKLSGWWSQMVTVGYEQARLGRSAHEGPDGFRVTVSKTVAVPLETLFAAWNDAKRRAHWLDAPIHVTKATANKYLRAVLDDGTRLAIGFLASGKAKAQVALEHGKLKDAQAAAAMKARWAAVMAKMKGAVERE